MTYLFMFIYIILYSNILEKIETRRKEFFMYFLPIAGILLLIFGLQDNVGTDYDSYLRIAEGTKNIGFIENKSEMLFVYIVEFVRLFNNPQLIFVLIAAIQTFFLMLIVYEIKKLKFRLDVFFFLYFSLALVFFNQFNGIRQYTAVYIIVYAVLLLMNKKKKSFIPLIIMAGLFHTSAYFFLFLLPVHRIMRKKISTKLIIFALIGLLAIYFVDLGSILNRIVSYIPQYSKYLDSSYMRSLTIREIITKIPKLAIVIFAIINVNEKRVKEKETFLINLSFMACGVLILSFSSTVIWRFYQYFDMFLIFPVMMLMEDRSKRKYSILIAIMLILMLIVKIIVMPTGEYLYNSILF